MLFNSIEFILFFPAVTILYFLLPHRLRWLLLLCASYYFYMSWKPEFILLILASTLVDYYAALRMAKTEDRSQRRMYLLFSITVNLWFLFLFKYASFFGESTNKILSLLDTQAQIPAFTLILPIGISFYTFQTLSYTIDVYRGDKAAEKHFGIFALYVAFFPQLVAGPIERSTRLIGQFRKHVTVDARRILEGLKLMTWGFFKKVVIADRLAGLVQHVYRDPDFFDGSVLGLATYLFAFQIYCDFSGYSDIAIGAARVLGIDLMENFRRPYFSRSVGEFWTRWHISLSTWFKDYLYIPLGGNRVVKWRWHYNLFVVFIVSGLWHGANWKFAIWGALHGSYLIASTVTADFRRRCAQFIGLARFPRVHRMVRTIITFHLVVFAWIFFRADSVSDAFLIVEKILMSNVSELRHFVMTYGYDLAVSVLAIAFMELVHLLQSKKSGNGFLAGLPLAPRWACYYLTILSILMFGEFNLTAFIYFQF